MREQSPHRIASAILSRKIREHAYGGSWLKSDVHLVTQGVLLDGLVFGVNLATINSECENALIHFRITQ